MSLARLRDRAASARFHSTAILPAHRLKFQKIGKGNSEDRVIGVVYEIADTDKPTLDRHEGLGSGYAEKKVEVITDTGTIPASAYFATVIDDSLKPFHWYKQHVLVGARENHLPADYIAQIEEVESIDDPDAARHARELAIYR